ncbi:bifunctional transcriptional activator/DNA repair enzyme AdaA [Enterococcus sp. DIV1420a]|uniref:bifunctional transcriptional activator/DNA repair enzyme AdaA n=1 Tax=Enterococcus sp. DIV1420a TaxID=2774672 RepID=UPI003F1EB2A1
MINGTEIINHYYDMLIEKDPSYEGIFFVGIKTTGVFCRPTCPAKKPLLKNCEFFNNAQEALLASYRPCKRCKPLISPSSLSDDVKKLVYEIENNPQKKWTDKDFEQLSIHPNTARRQFKKQFGMTFIEYSRARRLGLAFKRIREGNSIIDTQLEIGFGSGNGFRDAFSNIMGDIPSNNRKINILYSSWLETRLGSMIAISDSNYLYLLEFVDRRGLENEIKNLRIKMNASIVPSETNIIKQLKEELDEYFVGERAQFDTPIYMIGSDFQKKVWNELIKTPTGKTLSYKELASKVGNPLASRAVASANGKNQISILIPCHRIINKNGGLGGYGGGIERKKWLIYHEKSLVKNFKERGSR